MPITLPSYVAPNELIQSAWGNAVVSALAEVDNEFVEKIGDTMTGGLTVNGLITTLTGVSLPAGEPTGAARAARKDYVDSTTVSITGDEMTGALEVDPAGGIVPLKLRNGSDVPSIIFESQAGTNMAQIITSATFMSIDTLSNNGLFINAPTSIETGSGSLVLNLKATTETPQITLESTAGTDLLTVKGSATTSAIACFQDLTIAANSNTLIELDGNAPGLGFFGHATAAKPTVSGSRGGNAALASLLTGLANLGLITDSSS